MSTSTSFFHLDTTGMLRAKYNGEKKTGILILRGLKDKDEGGRKPVIRTENLTN